jgi:tetratricopeptide (TPR) repeat protein
MSARRRFSSAVVSIVLLLASGAALATDRVPRALNRREVVALVGARVLPETMAADIASSGLKFRPDDAFLERLRAAGAGEAVTNALRGAKAVADEPAADDSLEHLFRAAEKANRDDVLGAAREIAAVDGNFESDPELAFVMADLFERVEQFKKAALVYSQIATVDPEFPEIHAKLAYALYRAGENDRAISEARAALERTPTNREAQQVLDAIESDYAAATGNDSSPRNR